MLPDGAIAGPLEPAQIGEIEAFGPETLVCSEHFYGTGDHAWIRAGFIGELRSQLPRALRIIPPDPTLAEAAAIGSLEKRVLELETLLLDALERLREKGRDLKDLALDSREREREVAHLRATLKKISSRVGGLGSLDAQLNRLSDQLQLKEQSIGKLRKSFEQGIEEAARTAAESIAEAHTVIKEAASIAKKAIQHAEKATASAKASRKVRRQRRTTRTRKRKKKSSGPDPFAA